MPGLAAQNVKVGNVRLELRRNESIDRKTNRIDEKKRRRRKMSRSWILLAITYGYETTNWIGSPTNLWERWTTVVTRCFNQTCLYQNHSEIIRTGTSKYDQLVTDQVRWTAGELIKRHVRATRYVYERPLRGANRFRVFSSSSSCSSLFWPWRSLRPAETLGETGRVPMRYKVFKV